MTEQLKIAVTSDWHLSNNNKFFNLYDVQLLIDKMAEEADILLFLGDFVNSHSKLDAQDRELAFKIAHLLEKVSIPKYGLIGNHGRGELKKILSHSGGLIMMNRDRYSISNSSNSQTLGIIGIEGSFDGSLAHADYAPRYPNSYTMRRRIREVSDDISFLKTALKTSPYRHNIIAMHYLPGQSTIGRESNRKHYSLGSKLYEQIADIYREKVFAIVHGHAHLGSVEGKTHAGIPIYNAAIPALFRRSRQITQQQFYQPYIKLEI